MCYYFQWMVFFPYTLGPCDFNLSCDWWREVGGVQKLVSSRHMSTKTDSWPSPWWWVNNRSDGGRGGWRAPTNTHWLTIHFCIRLPNDWANIEHSRVKEAYGGWERGITQRPIGRRCARQRATPQRRTLLSMGTVMKNTVCPQGKLRREVN